MMKTAMTFILFLFMIAFAGCKNEVPIDELELVVPKVEDEHFRVSMYAIVPKDDTFALYYTLEGNDFSKLQPLWTPVSGKKDAQEVQFVLPKGVKPAQLRLDFGLNKQQGIVAVKKIKMTYNQTEFNTAGQDILNYFRPDESKCTINPGNGAFTVKVANGEKQNPSLYPMEAALSAELTKLTQ